MAILTPEEIGEHVTTCLRPDRESDETYERVVDYLELWAEGQYGPRRPGDKTAGRPDAIDN